MKTVQYPYLSGDLNANSIELDQVRWLMAAVPVLGRLRRVVLCIQGHPEVIHSKFRPASAAK